MVIDNRQPSARTSHKQSKKSEKNTEQDAPSQARRGLIKAGLISAPVILTLKSQAALAAKDHPNPNLSKFSLGKSKPHHK